MGTQIRIAQTLEDEEELNEVLLMKWNLLCLPWSFASPYLQPQRLGECDGKVQIIFCDSFRQTVMDNIRLVSGETGRYHVFPKNGLCIQWTRTVRKGRGFIPGRYYFDSSSPVSESSSVVLKKVMALIVRNVRRTYPKKSGKRYPVFVGPDLAKMLDKQEADLAYLDGTVMPVINNS
jgi:hypothetical protein